MQLPAGVVRRVSRRARRLQLRLSPAGRCVVLTVPEGVPEGAVERFLAAQAGWIAARLAGLPPPVPFREGVVLPVGGRELHLKAAWPGKRLCLAGDNLHVAGRGALYAGRVRRFLKKEALDLLTRRAEAMAAGAGLAVKSVRVADTRSRWGSCTAMGELMFSWRLVLAPSFVLEAIVAHEVAHVQEMHHGPAFWRLAARILTENGGEGRAGQQKARRWLGANGALLYSYGVEPLS